MLKVTFMISRIWPNAFLWPVNTFWYFSDDQ
jgi:hypothetical protein